MPDTPNQELGLGEREREGSQHPHCTSRSFSGYRQPLQLTLLYAWLPNTYTYTISST